MQQLEFMGIMHRKHCLPSPAVALLVRRANRRDIQVVGTVMLDAALPRTACSSRLTGTLS